MGELSLGCWLLLTMLQMLKLLLLIMVLIIISWVVDVVVLYGGGGLFGGDNGSIAAGNLVDAISIKWIFKQRFYPVLQIL